MNINKFTQKSIQAVQDCEKIAYDYGHQELAQEHLLYALMKDSEGLLPKLLTKMDMVPEVFTAQVEGLLAKRPKVSGGAQVYVGNDLNKVLIYAEDEAKAMGDAYVSVEHLFLSLLKQPSKEVKELFRTFGITRERFLQALATVRGN
ncbi:MAG: Clp protease N-terminal domain-containing protein, partial [Lachnospiraceae bacterium]